MWNTELSNLYEQVMTEELQSDRSGFVRTTRGTVAPTEGGDGLSYRNYKMGLTPPNIAAIGLNGISTGANEQEEGCDPISMVEREYEGDSQINNAVRLALAKVRKLMTP